MSLPEPYYDADGVTIYHADCRDVLPHLDPADVALLLTDPPYGVMVQTNYGERQRGRIGKANDYPAVVGDEEPFEPRPLLRFSRLVLWGAHHYADRLPSSGAWLVWDRETGTSDTADADLAWTNLGGTVRKFTYMWNGICRRGEKDTHGLHPTQKPVALMRWIVDRWTQPGDLVLDPYMGSGPVARACMDLGRRYIGIEIVERYCAIAVKRLAQGVLPLGGAP